MNKTKKPLEESYAVKHVLSSGWLDASCHDSNKTQIRLSIDSSKGISFEKNDKIILKKGKRIYNTVISDMDFNPGVNEMLLTVEKPEERRNNRRYTIDLACTFIHEGKLYSGQAIDISRSGFKLMTSTRMKKGDTVELSVALSNLENINSKTKIIYASKNTEENVKFEKIYGLNIVEIDNINKITIKDFIDSLK